MTYSCSQKVLYINLTVYAESLECWLMKYKIWINVETRMFLKSQRDKDVSSSQTDTHT